ncbi:MAG: hypothetical protein IAG13_19355 [Deltaproteobacteria bacterium]|nr:hypothetical protein [Nannocystaceae bacterium]
MFRGRGSMTTVCACLLVGPACGDDAPNDAGEGSSSSAGVDETSAGPSTGIDEPTTSSPDSSSGALDSSSDDASSDDTSSTGDGVHAMGDLRVFYVDPGEAGAPGATPTLLEVLAGEPQPPIALRPAGPGSYDASWYGDDRWLVVTPFGADNQGWVFDVSTPTPLAGWPLGVLTKGGEVRHYGYAPVSQRLALWTLGDGDEGAGLQIVTLDDDGPSAPFDVTASAPATLSVDGGMAFTLDEQSVVFGATDTETEAQSLWIASAVPGGEAMRVLVEQTDTDLQINDIQSLGGSLVTYFVPSGAAFEGRVHIVDVAASPSPIDVEVPLLPESSAHRWPVIAPDSSMMVLREFGDAEDGYVSIAIVDGVPQAPVQLDVGVAAGDPSSAIPRWSADSRWFQFEAGVSTQVVVRVEGGVPSAPQEIGEDLGFVRSVHLSPLSDFVYFVGGETDDRRVMRSSLQGDELGAPEPLTEPIADGVTQISVARDGASLTYVTGDDAAPSRAYFIDVSGDEPGDPIQLATLVEDPGPGGSSPFAGGEYAVYGIPDLGSTLVNVAAGQAFPIAESRSIYSLAQLP